MLEKLCAPLAWLASPVQESCNPPSTAGLPKDDHGLGRQVMQAVTPLPWMACAPSSMTGISRPCQDTEVVFGLLRLATTRQTDPGDQGK